MILHVNIIWSWIWISLSLLLPFAQSARSECPSRSVPQVRRDLEVTGEISLLFYYVSWSSDARQALLVYNGVAHYYKDYASFGAIDCWHMQCNCSRTHPQLPGMAANGGYPDKWPTLIVRYGRRLRLQYQGKWHFEDLTRFMNNLVQPIDRLHTTAELGALWKTSDAVVLALLNNSDELSYRRFIATALHWLELDPERNVRFAVTFGPSAMQMFKLKDVTLPQLVVIDSRHGLHSYNETLTWIPVDILHWLRPKVNPLMAAGYGTPMNVGLKARHMPVLAMGIRLNQHHPEKTHFLSAELAPKENLDCEQYWQQDVQTGSPKHKWSRMEMPRELYRGVKSTDQLDKHCYLPLQLHPAALVNYYRINSYLNYLWSQYSHENQLEREARRLLAMHTQYRCLAHTHAQQGTPTLKIGIAKLVTKYTQLLWQQTNGQTSQNRSMGVVLYDASRYRDYLQQLGIEYRYQREATASAVQVFIVDALAESLYVMPQEQPFSYRALKDFIKQFYARKLPRMQRNALVATSSNEAFYIYNYNRQMLLKALRNPNSTHVVFMFRPDCGLSAVMSQSLMQVAALLQSPNLSFMRFNGQANDLPWELSMSTTPALLIFPESRPSETVTFPLDVRPDTANIMSFVLAQLEPEEQLRTVLASCRRRMRHARSCLDFAGKLVLQHVSKYLGYWETFLKERDSILMQLKRFNAMHVAIENSINL